MSIRYLHLGCVVVALSLGSCLESPLINCPWGLVCSANNVCHEKLQRCVAPLRIQACEGVAEEMRCSFPGAGQRHICRQGVCTEPSCGDHVEDEREQCDDGNSNSHDGCSDTCRQESFGWTKLSPAGEAPPALSATAMVLMDFDSTRPRVLLFGGRRADASVHGGTWILELGDALTWRSVSGDGPSARADHAMAFDQRQGVVVLYGGEGVAGSSASSGVSDETWVFDPGNESWQRVDPPSVPPARGRHAMVWDARLQQITLWGGEINEAFDRGVLHAWLFDGANWQMREGQTYPTPPRQDHAMIFDPNGERVLVFGGWNRSTRSWYSELWAFDGDDWSQVSATDSPLLPRKGSAAAFDYRMNQMVIFGGQSGLSCSSGDLCRRCEEAEEPAPGRCAKTPELLDDTWFFRDNSWEASPQETKPSVRLEHAMVTLGKSGGVLLFGGMAKTPDEDTYERFGDLWIGRFEARDEEKTCGNDRLDAGEVCDQEGSRTLFAKLGGEQPSCALFGYAAGTLKCNPHCAIDTSGCEAVTGTDR